MKDHEIREFINELTAVSKKYEGCQCLREAIANVVKKRLRKTEREV